MIQWKKFDALDLIPKDGTRVLLGNYGLTYARSHSESEEYIIYSLFQTDIVMFDWENPEANRYIKWTRMGEFINGQELMKIYNIFTIINEPRNR